MVLKPSVGRIVHYVAYGTPGGEYKPAHRAAIVTDVNSDGTVLGLCVLNPTGMFFNTTVNEDQTGLRGGTWHWPERD
jgi:hypothetical protein